MQQQDTQNLDDKRRIEIMQMVGEFRGKEFTSEQIEEFCKANEIDQPVTEGYLKDYILQADMDIIMSRILPEIFDIMKAKHQWTPLFALQAAHDEANKAFKESAEEIVKLVEREGVPYFYAESLVQSFEEPIRATFDAAARICKRRSTDVFEHLASKHFGKEAMTMADVQEYTKEHLEK